MVSCLSSKKENENTYHPSKSASINLSPRILRDTVWVFFYKNTKKTKHTTFSKLLTNILDVQLREKCCRKTLS